VLPTDELLVTSMVKLALERIVVKKGAFLHQEVSCCRAPVADLRCIQGERPTDDASLAGCEETSEADVQHPVQAWELLVLCKHLCETRLATCFRGSRRVARHP